MRSIRPKENPMDSFTYSIEIGDLNAQNFERMDVLVDTREFYTTLPASTLRRLGIAPTDTREFQLADGSIIHRDIAQVRIGIDGQRHPTIVVFGDEDETPTLGSYTLTGHALEADPVNKRFTEMEMLQFPATIAVGPDGLPEISRGRPAN